MTVKSSRVSHQAFLLEEASQQLTDPPAGYIATTIGAESLHHAFPDTDSFFRAHS
jgi:hypothetical protein